MKFQLTDINYTYNGTSINALTDITIALDSGKITGLVGANGSGKSTLIKILLRQLIRYTGHYTIDAVSVTDNTGSVAGMFGVGYAPEDIILDDALTGYEMLQLVKEVRNISDKDFTSDLEYLSSSLRVEDWLQKKTCAEYSQGMKRKCAIILAMIGPLKYLILDEPNNGLDPLSIYGLKQAILKCKERGTGVLISTHILDIIDKVSDDVVMLRKGRIIYSGMVTELREMWPQKDSLEEIYCEMYSKEDGMEV
jgi:ABC-type multidrug transport system ATPase subunit